MQLDNEHILVHCPFALGNVGVEMVVPPLTTLLSNAARQAFGDLSPILGSASRHYLSQDLIFASCPGAFGEVATVYELQPACMTLDFGFPGQKLADAIPRILTKSLNIPLKFLILQYKIRAIRNNQIMQKE